MNTKESMGNMERKDFLLPLSNRMQKFRRNKRITQKEMADLLGVSPNHISNIERGATDISAFAVIKYCQILKVEPNEMINFVSFESEKDAAILQKLRTLSQEAHDIIESMVDYMYKKERIR